MPYTPMPLAGFKASLKYSSTPSVAMSNESTSTTDSQHYQIENINHAYWDASVAIVVREGLPEIETVAITGNPTGGSFTLTFGGQTTAAIAYNATAAQVATALGNLSNVGTLNVICTGGPLPATAVVVQFDDALAPGVQPLMTHTDSFTGGTTPAAAVTETQHGTAYATVSASNYTLQYLGGWVYFNSVQSGTAPMVQILSGNYFPTSYLGQAESVDIQADAEMYDTTAFSTTGTASAFKTFIAGLLGATFKISRYYLDATFFLDNLAPAGGSVLLAIIVYMGQSTTERFEAYCWLKQEDIKTAVNKTVDESLDLQATGVFSFYA